MSPSCVSSAKLTAFLAGELTPDDDRAVAQHLDGCSHCEQLADELTDDREARELAAAAVGKQPAGANEPQLEDLCRRLHALGLYELAVSQEQQEQIDDTQSNLEPRQRTSVLPNRVVVRPAEPPPGPAEEPPPRFKRLGRYELVRTLGAGTFGIVYLAQDTRLNRPVALKIARATVLADDHLRLRFVREAEVLAKLQHPHIVPVYEADEIEGLCYLAIAFCDGPTLDQWLLSQQGRLDPRLAVKLLLPLVDAVEHAHVNGVLHRDIKPANIILERAEGEAGGLTVVPRLTDFGLAKIVEEKTSSTLSGIVLGTAQYMAPEQAAGHLERIGPATDVYGLGAVLYEMLTGRPPIEGNTTIDTLRRLLIDDPAEVGRLVPGVPSDLDAIVMRCLNKSVTDRYASAADLAADLRRFLDGRPTVARPLTLRQRAGRWLQRNPLRAALLAVAGVALILAAGLYRSSQQLSQSQFENQRWTIDLEASRRDAAAALLLVAQRDYCNNIRSAAKAIKDGDVSTAATALKRCLPSGESPDLRGFEWHYLWALATQDSTSEAQIHSENYQLGLSPDRRELAAVGKDGLLRLFESRTLKPWATIPTYDETNGEIKRELNGVAYSSDGRLIATGGDDGTIRIFDAQSRQVLRKLVSHAGKVYGVVFFDGGKKLASCGDELPVRLWNAATGESLGVLTGHQEQIEALTLSPDGRLLATVSSDGTCKLWGLAERKLVRTLAGHSGRLLTVCFSPDGRLLATAGQDRIVSLWDVATGTRHSTETHFDGVQTVSFSRNGRWLFAGDRSGSLRKYHVAAPVSDDQHYKLKLKEDDDVWQAHDERVWCVISGPDPASMITAGADGLVRIWPTKSKQLARRVLFRDPADLVVDLAYSPGGDRLFALHENGGVEMLDAATLKPRGWLHSWHSRWRTLTVLADRDEVAAGNAHGIVAIWNWKTGEQQRLIGHPGEDFAVNGLIYSPPAGLLGVLPFNADDVRLYHAATGESAGRIKTNNHSAGAFSLDGRRLAVDSLNNIYVHEIPSRALLHTLTGHRATINGLSFNAQGWLASASADRSLRLWSPHGDAVPLGSNHLAALNGVAYTPDGRTLVSIDEAGVLKLTQPAADRELLEVPTETRRLRIVAVAPDSRRLAVLREDHSVLVLGTAAQP